MHNVSMVLFLSDVHNAQLLSGKHPIKEHILHKTVVNWLISFVYKLWNFIHKKLLLPKFA